MNATKAAKNFYEDVFQLRSKKIEGEHIKNQVHVIAVNKSGTDHSVVLTLRSNPVGIHHQIVEELWLLHGKQTDARGDDDDAYGDGNFHGEKYNYRHYFPCVCS